jgi:hypothetical protein
VMEANFDGKILRSRFNVTRTSVKSAPAAPAAPKP